jgi:hypothetical protein
MDSGTSCPWRNVFNTIGTWLTRLGTVLASVVALRVANRDNSLCLRVYATIGLLINDSENPARKEEFVCIRYDCTDKNELISRESCRTDYRRTVSAASLPRDCLNTLRQQGIEANYVMKTL